MQPGDDPDTVVDPSVMAERRFRRAGGDDGLPQRLAEAEAALAAARTRADELAGRLEVRERELAEAREAGFAEQRRRLEIEADAGRGRHAVDAEVSRLRASLVTAEARIAELEEQVAGERLAASDARVAELEALLAEERRGRSAQRRAFEGHIAALERGIAAAREQLAAVGEGLAAERAVVDERLTRVEAALVSAHLLAATGGASDADALVAVRALGGTEEADGVRAPACSPDPLPPSDSAPAAAPAPAPAVPDAGHPALVDALRGAGASATGADSVIVDLARAAARLREQIEAQGPAGAQAQAPAPDAPAAAPAPPPERVQLPVRIPAWAPPAAGWIPEALAALARRDDAAAARLLLAAAPLHGARLGGALEYVLVPAPLGAHRVSLGAGGAAASVTVATEPPGRLPVIAGPPAALAPLLAGGAGRRLRGADVARRRRARRLLKALREPAGLAELAVAGVAPDPADVLALLAAAVAPERTRGSWATVGFAVEGEGGAALSAADGAALAVLAGVPSDADAVVHATSRTALLGVLAGTVAASVSGDRATAEAVLGWLDGAQARGA